MNHMLALSKQMPAFRLQKYTLSLRFRPNNLHLKLHNIRSLHHNILNFHHICLPFALLAIHSFPMLHRVLPQHESIYTPLLLLKPIQPKLLLKFEISYFLLTWKLSFLIHSISFPEFLFAPCLLFPANNLLPDNHSLDILQPYLRFLFHIQGILSQPYSPSSYQMKFIHIVTHNYNTTTYFPPDGMLQF